jgi:acylglycerol lipase
MYLKKILAENPGLPCFCFGHSTGGGIILKAMLDPEVDSCVEGIFLTSPAVRVQPAHPIIKVMAPVFALIAPRYQFTASHRNGPPVSRDPEALKAKYSDQLVFTGSIRVRTGYEILRLTSYLQQHLHRITVPMLVMHGADDMVTDPQGSQKLYEEASSSDKSLNLYNGLLHDLLIEPEKEKIMDNIVDWLSPRI